MLLGADIPELDRSVAPSRCHHSTVGGNCQACGAPDRGQSSVITGLKIFLESFPQCRHDEDFFVFR